jgi:t-SNARE complex subunit (syntaxin)
MSIYIIRSKDLSLHDCYIGSTKDFNIRKNKHKSNCYNKNEKHYNINLYQFIRANGGWDNFEMVEICKCDTDKLRETEQYHIDFIKPSLNEVRAFGIDYERRKENCKDYYERNRDVIRKYKKDYREKNRDKIVEKNRKWYNDNKDELLKKYKEYRENNKDKIKERQKTKLTCECGTIYTTTNKARHFKSNKHKNYIQSLSSS